MTLQRPIASPRLSQSAPEWDSRSWRRMSIPAACISHRSRSVKAWPFALDWPQLRMSARGAMRSVIEERDKSGLFRSLEDFCARLDGRTVNRKILESLVKCGAFDCFREVSRRAVCGFGSGRCLHAAGLQRDRASGQGALFEELHGIHRPAIAPVATVEPWPRNEMLAYERELLGFYLTGHPLEPYSGHFDSPKITTISAAQRIEESSTVRLAGIVCSVEKKFTKKDGKPFAVIVLEDFTGQMELTAWDEVFADKGSLLNPGAVISVAARLTRRDDSVRAIINTLSPLKPKASLKPVRLRLARGKLYRRGSPRYSRRCSAIPGQEAADHRDRQ